MLESLNDDINVVVKSRDFIIAARLQRSEVCHDGQAPASAPWRVNHRVADFEWTFFFVHTLRELALTVGPFRPSDYAQPDFGKLITPAFWPSPVLSAGFVQCITRQFTIDLAKGLPYSPF